MKKILVVDDHRLMLDFMKNLLLEEGHHVLTAENSLSALEILSTDTPDIIFIDLVLPDISGEKLCQIIRMIPRLQNVYLVILSAIAAEEQVDIAALRANACIAKGPTKKMAKHVLSTLEQSDSEGSAGFQETVLGVEDIYPRHITKELLFLRRHFQIILDTMSQGILEITHEAKIVYANPSAALLSGMAEGRLLGSDFIDLFFETDREKVRDLLNSAMQNASKGTEHHPPVLLNDKDVLLDFLQVGDEEDGSILVILTDVTVTRRLEAKLRQAHKMEAIGTLVGGIAHGFNNLLMGIQGNASLILSDIDSTHPYYDWLKNIEKQVQSGARLTSHLLGYARKERYEAKPLDLNQLVEETSETFGITRREIDIHRELAEDLLMVEGDHRQIEQVLLNLYLNAAEAMPAGGDLILKTTKTTHEDMTGKMYDPKPGDYVLLTVTDRGIGMEEETVRRVFDPFFTTKEAGSAAGLGLTSAYGIIKGHGGYIDVESMKGQGTTVSIYLPGSKRTKYRTLPKD
jgi:signal transduction histidine kinase